MRQRREGLLPCMLAAALGLACAPLSPLALAQEQTSGACPAPVASGWTSLQAQDGTARDVDGEGDGDRPAHTHQLVAVGAEGPTCTDAGHIAHWECAGGFDCCHRRFADEAGTQELREEEVTVAASGHTPAPAVVENRVEATGDTPASFDSVTYCAVCGAVMGSVHVTEGDSTTEVSAPEEHECSPGAPVREVEVAPTCTEAGSAQEVTRCAICDRELSRTAVTLDPLGHDWTEPTYEWEDDLSQVRAIRTCLRDPSHTESETAIPVMGTDESAPTSVTLTATFENPAFGRVSRQVQVELPGDQEVWYEPTDGGMWNDDTASMGDHGSLFDKTRSSGAGDTGQPTQAPSATQGQAGTTQPGGRTLRLFSNGRGDRDTTARGVTDTRTTGLRTRDASPAITTSDTGERRSAASSRGSGRTYGHEGRDSTPDGTVPTPGASGTTATRLPAQQAQPPVTTPTQASTTQGSPSVTRQAQNTSRPVATSTQELPQTGAETGTTVGLGATVQVETGASRDPLSATSDASVASSGLVAAGMLPLVLGLTQRLTAGRQGRRG